MRRCRTRRVAVLPHPGRELARDGERLRPRRRRRRARRASSRAARRATCSTQPCRRRDADPEPVVLAHEQDRQRVAAAYAHDAAVLSAACAVAWFTRGVAERCRRRSRRPARRQATPSSGRALDRERDPDGARQVRGDRGGLRDDREVGVAEHLVAAARDRLVVGGRHAEQHVPDAVPAGLRRPREVEAARAVVEQRRVGRPERQRDERRSTRGRRSRSCRSRASASGASVPRGRAPGCRRRAARRAPPQAAPLRRPSRASSAPQPREQMLLERVEVVAHGAAVSRAGTRRRRGASPPCAARRRRARPSRRAPRCGAARRRG